LKKICSNCGKERDAEQDFSWRDRDRRIRQPRCKYCQSAMSKLHYQNNKQTYNERTRLSKAQALAESRSRISSYLSTHPCVDCGLTDIRLLEFDHTNGQKSRDISDFLTWGFNWPTIEAEIAKCEVRCSNCHRIKTIEWGRGWRSTRPAKQPVRSYQMVRTYLSTHACVDCGETDIRVLEFDHSHGRKIDEISHLLSQGYGWRAIETEIAKCEVRCANCHRLKTMERGKWWRFGQS
jgi:hypothetical protein